jgi:hypothetical protein
MPELFMFLPFAVAGVTTNLEFVKIRCYRDLPAIYCDDPESFRYSRTLKIQIIYDHHKYTS